MFKYRSQPFWLLDFSIDQHFRMPLDNRERCSQVMGNRGDHFPVLLIRAPFPDECIVQGAAYLFKGIS